MLARLGLEKGATLHAIETVDGVRLMTSDPSFEADMKVACAQMKKWRNVLRELAK
jgi:hypothetical protein